MIVVFDTNIWKANLYLRSPAAAGRKLFLHMKCRQGWLAGSRWTGGGKASQTRHAIHWDRRSLGSQASSWTVWPPARNRLPTDDEIDTVIASVFSQSRFDLLDVPFSGESARSSFVRTIDKVPPSHKSQEFKDGVLWDNCKQLAETDDVVLVTDDHAFYERDDPKGGLATQLFGKQPNVRTLSASFPLFLTFCTKSANLLRLAM